MAAANYRLCDKCKAKTFYDSDVDYEDSNLGAMTALCKDCAQVYEITIAKRGGVAELRAAIREWSKANRACSQWVAGTVGNDEDELPLARLSRAERRLHALDATEGQP